MIKNIDRIDDYKIRLFYRYVSCEHLDLDKKCINNKELNTLNSDASASSEPYAIYQFYKTLSSINCDVSHAKSVVNYRDIADISSYELKFIIGSAIVYGLCRYISHSRAEFDKGISFLRASLVGNRPEYYASMGNLYYRGGINDLSIALNYFEEAAARRDISAIAAIYQLLLLPSRKSYNPERAKLSLCEAGNAVGREIFDSSLSNLRC